MKYFGIFVMIIAYIWMLFPELHLSTQTMLGFGLFSIGILIRKGN